MDYFQEDTSDWPGGRVWPRDTGDELGNKAVATTHTRSSVSSSAAAQKPASALREPSSFQSCFWTGLCGGLRMGIIHAGSHTGSLKFTKAEYDLSQLQDWPYGIFQHKREGEQRCWILRRKLTRYKASFRFLLFIKIWLKKYWKSNSNILQTLILINSKMSK